MMTRTVGVRELKQNASAIIRSVETEGPVLVTVQSRVMARIVRADQVRRITGAEIVDALRAQRVENDPGWAAEASQLREPDGPTDPFAA